MIYNVEAGKDFATIELTEETKVIFSFSPNLIAVKATSGTVTVALDEGAQSGDDGVRTITEGESTTIKPGSDGAVWINGTGTVDIWAGLSGVEIPLNFKKSSKGGGSGSGTAYKGTTTTALSNGSTANPITIDGESYTAVFGDIVVYNYTEYIFDGTQWSEFGRPFDTTPTSGSANAVTSDGIYALIRKGTGLYGAATLGNAINKATGGTSLAGGYNTTASGGNSVALGNTTTASGGESFAVGYNCSASGTHSFATGAGISANKENMTGVGKYNSPRSGDLFNIGNGTSNSNRSNILEVSEDDMNVNGDIKMNNIAFPTLYTTMPAVTANMLGKMALYVGTTGGGYVQGCFYVAVSDGAAEPTYAWKRAGDDGGGLPSEYEGLPYIQQNGYVGFPLLNYISFNGDIIECETARTNSTGSARFVNFNDNSAFLYDTNGTLLRTVGGYFTDLIGDRQWEVDTRYISKARITRDGSKINSIGSYNNGYAFALKWYYVKIYRPISDQTGETANTVLLHSLIPCRRKADDKVGMYDLKYNVFYVSTTGTDFTA